MNPVLSNDYFFTTVMCGATSALIRVPFFFFFAYDD